MTKTVAPSASRTYAFTDLRRLLATSAAPGPAVARAALATIMFPHGAQHALGWFGGYGFSGTFAWMTGSLHLPAVIAALAIVTELVAPIALLVGFGGRFAAVAIGGFILVAASTHAEQGFFMNWYGQMAAGQEGYEYHLLVAALAAVVALEGSGLFSVDRALTNSSARDA